MKRYQNSSINKHLITDYWPDLQGGKHSKYLKIHKNILTDNTSKREGYTEKTHLREAEMTFPKEKATDSWKKHLKAFQVIINPI